ncbi:MAG: hypothetical protein LBI28_02275 [Treponema sp.]|nr:hypothetical protein [Treponema sp.]
MSVRKFFIFILLAVFTSGLWAAGGKDNDNRTAADPSGFQDTMDTSERKPGRYNYYIEATDRAGNTARSGPDNITIDPASDLPYVTIINPLPHMRVQGNMNIVGLAFDDDAVDHVELSITRGTDGRGEELLRVNASGSDYWSYFLDTTNGDIWTDGNYTVTAWAVDINGLSGISDSFKPRQHRKSVVYWTLDRKKPDAAVTSHEVGALVSGRLRLRGTVADGNGISAFSYSVDGGERYIAARPSLDRRTGLYNWEINIDTKIFDDGPAVLWFRGIDSCGSIGTAAHLLFVNNTAPDVKIVYPEANTTVNGLFSIAGYAQHPVGLRSVTWKAGSASGEVELLPGNHWWTADVDLRNQKASSIDVEVRAVDVSGNTSVTRQRYRVNPTADLPVVTLTSPVPGLIKGNTLVVKGTATDNTAVASVFYSLDGGAAVEIPANGYFQFMIPNIPEGNHNLEVWAKDVTGMVGPKVAVRGIATAGAIPAPEIVSITSQEGRSPSVATFYTGMVIKPSPRMTMQVTVRSPAVPVNATVSFGDASPAMVRLTGSRDVFTATVPVPEQLPEGLLRIRLTAADRSGQEGVFDEYVFVSAYGLLENTFSWVRANTLTDGRILLKSGETLMGISPVPLANAVLSSGSNMLNVEIDNRGRVLLTATGDGEAGPFSLRLDTGTAGTFTSSQYRVLSDSSGPVITTSATNYNWVRNSAPVNFNISSRGRVNAVDVSLDMGDSWTGLLSSSDLSSLRAPVNTNVSRQVDISSVADGAVTILVRVSNESGLSATQGFTVLKDTQAPQAQLVMPVTDARVNGTIRMAFAVEEGGSLDTISYSRPARGGASSITREVYNSASWDKDYDPRFFEVLMDSTQMPLDESMNFTFTDKAGNTSQANRWDFVIDREMDIPVVHVILPQDNEVITTDFIVSGVMFDDDGIKGAQYRIDSGAWQTIDAENGFSIPILLSSLTDNEHSVTVVAEDIYGVRSQPVTRNFRVSLIEPAATVVYPLYDTVLKDAIEIRGTAFDRNGLKSVQVSLDNGNTFNTVRSTFGTASETIQWTYQFNTRILKDGAHVVFIRVVDRYDVPATYANMINIDNTPPEVILDSPGDGSMSVGHVSVMGRALDPNLSSLSIELRSLEGVTIPASLRNRRIELNPVIREGLEIAALPDGFYNVAVIANDRAGNITRVSRNLQLARQTYKNFVEILYPLENEVVSGEFNLYGYAGGADAAGTVTIRVNGRDATVAEVDSTGYYNFALSGEYLNPGNNTVIVHSSFGGGPLVMSRSYQIVYQGDGPWVTIDSFKFGEFAYDRPYLYGRTGYVLSEEDRELLADRSTPREVKAAINAKVPDYTEISFDNGRTFTRTSRAAARDIDYRYRLETGDMPEGMHYIVVRTTMKNEEIALTRMLVQVDKTNPVVRLITPEPGGRYNTEIAYSASATDDIELTSLTYHLRVGDKALYEVPGFLQGLYFEGIIPPFLKQTFNEMPNIFAGGATYTDFGFGLSFFDDNVKVQFQYGFMTDDIWVSLGGKPRSASGESDVRYGGHVFGIKLLASLYNLPFRRFLGPDFEWLFASFAIGANFSLFDLASEGYTQSGEPSWMSALLFQIEFPKVTIPKQKYLRTFSLFTEASLWFVPTDVPAAANNIQVVIPHIIMGLRLYIF